MKKDNSNLSRSGKSLSLKQFKSLVKEAEAGPFYSIEESKRIFNRDNLLSK